MSRKLTIYLDIDEVLADWTGAVRHFTAVTMLPRYDWDVIPAITSVSPEWTHDRIWETIEQQGSDFWADLKPLPWAIALYLWCTQNAHTVYLATTPTHDPNCLHGKLRWMYTHYGPRFDQYTITWNKSQLATRHTLLIDDSEKNCRAFVEAGGWAILFPALGNSNRGHLHDPIEYVRQSMAMIPSWAQNGGQPGWQRSL